MSESVYKVVELVGTSTQSWEKAAAAAVALASKSLRDLRVGEVSQLDMHIVDGKVVAYRAKVNLSFKYQSGDGDDAPKAPPAPKGRGRAKAAPPAMESAEEEEDMAGPAKAKKGARKTKRRPAKT